MTDNSSLVPQKSRLKMVQMAGTRIIFMQFITANKEHNLEKSLVSENVFNIYFDVLSFRKCIDMNKKCKNIISIMYCNK